MGGQSRQGGTKKPLTKVQTDEAKKRKEAFLSGKPLDSDDEDSGKAEAAKNKKILAEARAAAGKKGPISLGGQGIKKSGKK